MKRVWLGIVFILVYGLFSMKGNATGEISADKAAIAESGLVPQLDRCLADTLRSAI